MRREAVEFLLITAALSATDEAEQQALSVAVSVASLFKIDSVTGALSSTIVFVAALMSSSCCWPCFLSMFC